MNEEKQVTIIDSNPIEGMHRAGRAIGIYALSLFTVAFLGVLAYAIHLVSAYIIYLGYIAIVAVGILIVAIVATPVVFLLRWIFKADFYEITQHGVTFRNFWGKLQTVSPQSASAGVKFAQGKKGKKEETTIPMLSMLDMIDQDIIAPGQSKVVLGYTKDGALEIRKRPSVYVIAGKGRSGKSRRATLMIGQDLIALAPQINIKDRRAGARVIICDPHGMGKKDSIRKLLEPLAPWVEFFSTEEEVRRATSEYIEEMEKRLAGTSDLGNEDGRYVPWVLYYDEWSRFMTKYEDDFTELLINGVQSSAQEYAGVDGYVALLGQDWTNDACGGTAIRRAIQEAFVHNISAEYAKFLLPKGLIGNRWAVKAENLRVKDCIYKDYEGQLKELVTPHVADEVPAKLAELMMQLCPVDSAEPKRIPEQRMNYDPREVLYNTTGSATREQVAYQYTAPETPRLLQSPVSYSFTDKNTTNYEHGYKGSYEDMNAVNTPLDGRETDGPVMNGKQIDGETFIMKDDGKKPVPTEARYTHEQEVAVLQAAFLLARETGKVTRSDIMERLNWTRAQWPIIKSVCDKNNIAKQ